MCDTCGCGQPEVEVHEHEHERVVDVQQDILSKNNLLAERNRGYFEARGIVALNLVSSPGSGKTTLLERTISDLGKDITFSVVEGDQQSSRDADRIEATGAPVVQVNTGTGCHLDAHMVHHAVEKLNPRENSILMIENVGNLICPALFDLGESHKVLIISVTEGEDKPLKYPTMFSIADICLINKIDLLPYVDFDVDRCKEYAKRANGDLTFFEISAKTREGLTQWNDWIYHRAKKSLR